MPPVVSPMVPPMVLPMVPPIVPPMAPPMVPNLPPVVAPIVFVELVESIVELPPPAPEPVLEVEVEVALVLVVLVVFVFVATVAVVFDVIPAVMVVPAPIVATAEVAPPMPTVSPPPSSPPQPVAIILPAVKTPKTQRILSEVDISPSLEHRVRPVNQIAAIVSKTLVTRSRNSKLRTLTTFHLDSIVSPIRFPSRWQTFITSYAFGALQTSEVLTNSRTRQTSHPLLSDEAANAWRGADHQRARCLKAGQALVTRHELANFRKHDGDRRLESDPLLVRLTLFPGKPVFVAERTELKRGGRERNGKPPGIIGVEGWPESCNDRRSNPEKQSKKIALRNRLASSLAARRPISEAPYFRSALFSEAAYRRSALQVALQPSHDWRASPAPPIF